MKNWRQDILGRKLIQKAVGQLESQENEALDKLIEEDAAVKEEWKNTVLLVDKWGALPDVNESWQQLDSKISALPKRKLINTIPRKILVAAAVILFICISTFFIIYTFKGFGKGNLAGTGNNSKHLTLTLPDGQIVNLNDVQNIILKNGIRLQNDSAARQLSYNGVDEAGDINTLQVPAGLDYNLVLSDGTEIMLNSVTTLQFPFRFSGNTREITVSGEAYLKVAHDASRPFIVHTPGGDIRVLGTAFNVNTYTQKEKVSLVTGSIDFINGHDSIRLKPGYAAIWDNNAFRMVALDNNDLAWINGKYILDGTSVREIAQLLPRWYGVEVKIDNEEVANRLFNGVIYKNKPLSGLLDLLKGTTDVDYYYENNMLHLK